MVTEGEAVRRIGIDEAAGLAGVSRVTVERALRAYRVDPRTGLRHSREKPLNPGPNAGRALRGRVGIAMPDLLRWLDGRPPDPDRAGRDQRE